MVWVCTSEAGGTFDSGGTVVEEGVGPCKKEEEGEELLSIGGGDAREELFQVTQRR